MLAYGHIDVLAQRELPDGDLLATVGRLEPRWRRPAEGVHVELDDDHLAGLVAQADDVALADAVAGDVDPTAVDVDVAVVHELAGLRPGRRPPGAVHDVVEPQLAVPQEVLAGHAVPAVRLLVEVAELLLRSEERR